MSLTEKGLVLVLVPVVFELVFVLGLLARMSWAEDRLEELQKTRSAIVDLQRGMTDSIRSIALLHTDTVRYDPAARLERFQRLYDEFSAPYHLSGVDLKELPELKELASEFEVLRKQLMDSLPEFAAILHDKNIEDSERVERISAHIRDGQSSLVTILFEIMNVSEKTSRLKARVMEAGPDELRQINTELSLLVGIGVLFSLGISLTLAWLYSVDLIRRIDSLAENARLLAAFEELPAQDQGTDELAAIDRALHESSELLLAARDRELAILDNAGNIICSLDRKLRIEKVNSAVERLWFRSPDEITGSLLSNLVRRDQIEKTVAAFEAIAVAENQSGELENTVKRGDGSFAHCRWSISFNARTGQFFCVVRDVTRELQVERLKQYMLSIVSHDLRAPLTAVGINLEMIDSGAFGEVKGEIDSEVEAASITLTRLMSLINDLLELEKVDSQKGDLDLDRDCLSLSELCDGARESLSAAVAEKNLKLKGPVGDAAVNGDRRRLAHAVSILLANAVANAPERSTVEFSLRRDGNMVELHVHDDGPPLTPEAQERIFDRYHLLHSRTSAAPDRRVSELGLALVAAIAEKHQGRCGVADQVTEGCSFYIALPEFLDAEVDEETDEDLS
ncbi:MAG: PAS domain-containing protein [Cyanobacteria bacterium HKST-UBA02]|nr:PAS domain-containing protein [Cyanobacteria bacterium HKST-UBA02]